MQTAFEGDLFSLTQKECFSCMFIIIRIIYQRQQAIHNKTGITENLEPSL
jgi:hypothetical protein